MFRVSIKARSNFVMFVLVQNQKHVLQADDRQCVTGRVRFSGLVFGVDSQAKRSFCKCRQVCKSKSFHIMSSNNRNLSLSIAAAIGATVTIGGLGYYVYNRYFSSKKYKG